MFNGRAARVDRARGEGKKLKGREGGKEDTNARAARDFIFTLSFFRARRYLTAALRNAIYIARKGKCSVPPPLPLSLPSSHPPTALPLDRDSGSISIIRDLFVFRDCTSRCRKGAAPHLRTSISVPFRNEVAVWRASARVSSITHSRPRYSHSRERTRKTPPPSRNVITETGGESCEKRASRPISRARSAQEKIFGNEKTSPLSFLALCR